uniref:Uncharacterized protein n=1 Tax=Arundo donax TaxID=35708 RepID=A0A0A9FTP3_ARUDO
MQIPIKQHSIYRQEILVLCTCL